MGKLANGHTYSTQGRYLGEVMLNNRLITHRSKKHWPGPRWVTYGRVAGFARYANYAGDAMYAGYEDFPPPEDFE